MKNRRFAIIAGLGVVELWVIGLMFRSVAGGFESSPHPVQTVSMPSAPAAPSGSHGRVVQTIESGSAPHVVIDDDDTSVNVSVKAGSTVDVREQTNRTGWVRDHSSLRVEKTADGVSISRDGDGLVFEIGSMQRRLDVVVPPQTRLEVKNAGATTIAGLRAQTSLHSDNGPIEVSDVVGSINITTDNGRVTLRDIAAPSVDVVTDNGRVTFDRVRTDAATVTADNGRIEVANSFVRGGKIQTDSGRIELGLAAHSDVTVSAHTSSGRITAQAPLTVTPGGSDDAPSTIRVGTGAGRLEVGSDNGAISIFTGGS